MKAEDHVKLRDVLSRIEGKFILSYDDHLEVRRLYKDFNIQETRPTQYSLNNREGLPARRQAELLITKITT